MSSPRFRSAALMMLVLHLGACTSWQVVPISPREFIEAETPESVRITTDDGSQIIVSNPQMVGDSISADREDCGWSDEGVGRACATVLDTFAEDDIRSLEVTSVSPFKTLGLVFVGAVAFLGGGILCCYGS